MTSFKTASDVRIEGYAGSRKIVAIGYVEHGKGKRRVELEIEPSVILALAKYLQRNPESIGHAVYHLNTPELNFPCLTCEDRT